MRLRCTDCGLVYQGSALAREQLLTTGSSCRRCGGELAVDDPRRPPPADPGPHPAIVAVRSAVTGHERLPFA